MPKVGERAEEWKIRRLELSENEGSEGNREMGEKEGSVLDTGNKVICFSTCCQGWRIALDVLFSGALTVAYGVLGAIAPSSPL